MMQPPSPSSKHSGMLLLPQPLFVPGPPFPVAYGRTAAMALGLGLGGGFMAGLYALGVLAFGWPAASYAPLVQAHGQLQTLGLAGLLILGVGGLLLPGFWRTRLAHPKALPAGAALVSIGLLGQLIGQPLEPGPLRQVLLLVAAFLPVIGFLWGGYELVRPRFSPPAPAPAGRAGAVPEAASQVSQRPAPWEQLLLLAAGALLAALALRAFFLLDLAWTSRVAGYGAIHEAIVMLELDGFLLAATLGVQLRLIPTLARTRPATGWPERVGIVALVLALLTRFAGIGLAQPALADLGSWLTACGALAIFWATGLGRAGLARTVEAPATLLPGRSRHVLRVAWASLLIGAFGRASGLLAPDVVTHAFTSGYLIPLILVVGIRMLPRVSAYPVRFPKLSGALVWMGVAGGLLRAFGSLLAGQAGWQLAWAGGALLTLALIVFAALAWSPWGVPTAAPRSPEEIAAYVGGSQRR